MNKIVEFLFQSGSNPVRNWILGWFRDNFRRKCPTNFPWIFCPYTYEAASQKTLNFVSKITKKLTEVLNFYFEVGQIRREIEFSGTIFEENAQKNSVLKAATDEQFVLKISFFLFHINLVCRTDCKLTLETGKRGQVAW